MPLSRKVNRLKVVLIDGYLDEPSCLGVPPYISPHIRYAYGALLDSGIRKENLDYFYNRPVKGMGQRKHFQVGKL